MLELVKNCLWKTISRDILPQKQIATLLCDIEAVLNSKPLTFLYNEFQSRSIDHLQLGVKIGLAPTGEDENDSSYTPRKEKKMNLSSVS